MLKDWLADRIARNGPIPFEDFMEAALYHPEFGYFSSTELRSVRRGDFLTSPEVSPMFGETLAHFVAAERSKMGEPFALIEVGAGSGSLLRPLVGSLNEDIEVWAVDRSPAARAALHQLLPRPNIVAELTEITPPKRGVVIANELLDNLPMALAVHRGTGWVELWVGIRDETLALMEVPARPWVNEWSDAHAGPVPEGGLVEVQGAAEAWLAQAIGLLEQGSVLVIDFGDTAEGLLPRRGDGTLRTYRAHHLGPHPLDEPGATDITADVNFTSLCATAKRLGCDATLQRQDEFLIEYGLRDRLSELRRQELEMTRSGQEMDRLAVRSKRTEAETLLHPRGLGDFRVLSVRIGN